MPGDIITTIDGKSVDSVQSLLARLDDHRVGDTVRLSVQREGRTREVTVELQPGT